jgi:hypothetical protein
MTFPFEQTVQTVKDIQGQAPTAICEIDPRMISFHFMVNATVRRSTTRICGWR